MSLPGVDLLKCNANISICSQRLRFILTTEQSSCYKDSKLSPVTEATIFVLIVFPLKTK